MKMRLYGTEVPSILFFRWWIAELTLALLGGYFGSDGFYPEALLVTGFYWLAFSALAWLVCSAYRDSEYCSLEGRRGFRVLRDGSCIKHLRVGFRVLSVLHRGNLAPLDAPAVQGWAGVGG